jgi:fatty acid desaturase
MVELDDKMRPFLTTDELRDLSRRTPWRVVLSIMRVYGLLIFVFGIAVRIGGPWLIPVFVIVAALQHAISILQHEAVHGLLFKNHRTNDLIGAFLLSYPIGFTMNYRVTHFAHHRFLGLESDPDLANYRPFPSTPATVWKKVLNDLSGISAVKQFFHQERGAVLRPQQLFGIVIAQLIIFMGFAMLNHPILYIVLWLLPLVTLTKTLTQLRNLAEHLTRDRAPTGAERLRTFQSNRLERFFFAPLNFNYHAEHHWYTTIPYYRLPAARRLLQSRAGYYTFAEMSPAYFSVLRRAASEIPT